MTNKEIREQDFLLLQVQKLLEDSKQLSHFFSAQTDNPLSSSFSLHKSTLREQYDTIIKNRSTVNEDGIYKPLSLSNVLDRTAKEYNFNRDHLQKALHHFVHWQRKQFNEFNYYSYKWPRFGKFVYNAQRGSRKLIVKTSDINFYTDIAYINDIDKEQKEKLVNLLRFYNNKIVYDKEYYEKYKHLIKKGGNSKYNKIYYFGLRNCFKLTKEELEKVLEDLNNRFADYQEQRNTYLKEKKEKHKLLFKKAFKRKIESQKINQEFQSLKDDMMEMDKINQLSLEDLIHLTNEVYNKTINNN